MIKKVRIQLFSKEGTPIEDRLVTQGPEFYMGPKEKHDGPIRIEFTIVNQTDVKDAITYLDKLVGDFPIEEKGQRGRTATVDHSKNKPNNDREILLKETLEVSKNQDDFIKKLREFDFSFVDSERLKQLIPESYKIKERHLEKYQWLIRRTKEAKDPKNDKLDPALLIGIVIMDKDKRTDKMVIYLHGEFSETITLEVPKNKAMGFKQTNLIKYPHYMTYEEREKWGFEHRALLKDPTKKPSKLYLRWQKDIIVGDELKLKTEK